MHYGPPPIFPDSLRIRRTRRIAIGGMAQVYLAERELHGGVLQPVVAKYMLPQFSDDPEFISRFRDEARIGLMLRHGNIVRVLDYAEVEGRYLIIMEFVDGFDLRAVMGRKAEEKQPFPEVVAAQFAVGLVSALAYIAELRGADDEHLNIVHRDISPNNLLISRRGVVKLADFGVAKGEYRETASTVQGFFGKYAYMSPEQILGQTLDARSDLFATGCVLYEMLTARRPYRGRSEYELLQRVVNQPPTSVLEYRPNLDRELAELTMRCLRRYPKDRWRTPFELLEGLHRYLVRVAEAPPVLSVVEYLDQLGLASVGEEVAPDLDGDDLSVELIEEKKNTPESPSYVRSLGTLQVYRDPPAQGTPANGPPIPDYVPPSNLTPTAVRPPPIPTPDPDPPPPSPPPVMDGSLEESVTRTGRQTFASMLTIAMAVVIVLALGIGGGMVLLSVLQQPRGEPVVEPDLEVASEPLGLLVEVGETAEPEEPAPEAPPISQPKTETPATTPEPTPAEVEPEPPTAGDVVAMGYITVEARPWAWVRIEGSSIGTTPVRHHEVPAGTVLIEVENQDTHWREGREVEVPAGEEVIVRFRQRGP